jgi:hypothetical protein
MIYNFLLKYNILYNIIYFYKYCICPYILILSIYSLYTITFGQKLEIGDRVHIISKYYSNIYIIDNTNDVLYYYMYQIFYHIFNIIIIIFLMIKILNI